MCPKLATTTPDNGEKYRVILIDDNGTIKKLVVPPPVALEATDIESTSFTANWKRSIAAESYRLDVSESEEFTTFVSDYENRPVSGTSESVTGLTEDTIYYYRVRAEYLEDTFSNNSNVMSTEEEQEFVLSNVDQTQADSFGWFEVDFLTYDDEGTVSLIPSDPNNDFLGDFVVFEYDPTTHLYLCSGNETNGYYVGSNIYTDNVNSEFKIDTTYTNFNDRVVYVFLNNIWIDGDIDVSMFNNLVQFYVYNWEENNITNVIFPNKLGIENIASGFVYIEGCSNITSLDFTNTVIINTSCSLTTVRFVHCENLTSILGLDGGTYSHFEFNDLGVSSIDLSNTTISTYDFWYADDHTIFTLKDLPNLTSFDINFDSTCRRFTVSDCPNLGYFDVTNWPNLTNISSTAGTHRGRWIVSDNDWDVETVNQVLVDFDTISDAGYDNRELDISGSNAAPDSSSGGNDGLAAKASLESKGFVVYTS